MHVPGLAALHGDMHTKGLQTTQFSFRYNSLSFDVIFFAQAPYQLLFGAVGHQCSFYVDVSNTFDINPVIRPAGAYSALCKALGLTYDPANPFSPQQFFTTFCAAVPLTAAAQTTVKLPTTPANPSSGNGTTFIRWLPHTPNNGNVTTKNLEKTEQAFGTVVAQLCRRRNVSSCWK